MKKKKNKNMEKKKLLYYEKNKFDEFVKKFPEGDRIVFPISYLTNQNTALQYTGIDKVKHFVIDITALVMSARERKDLRLIYESWINFLNEKNEDDIDYCVEKTYLQDACEIFSYYFEKNEEIDNVSDNVEKRKSIHEQSNEFAIVNCSKEKFDDILKQLNSQLYGHQKFKKDFKDQLEAFILLHRMKIKKVFSLLICGKSGIGKTEVARILQKEMYPTELSIKINFGNYSGKGSLWSLIGSPKGYVGSEQGGELTNKIINSKSKVIVIDELDKADEAIFTFFYEMLEDGQYTDLDGKVIDLDGYIIIFTANLNNSNFKNIIPEPLFSRFDMTYEFQPLCLEEKMKFVSDLADKLLDEYTEYIGELDKSEIKKQIMDENYQNYDNLRNIKRNVMNCFVKLVEKDSLWSSSINYE